MIYLFYWTRNLGGNWAENESFADSARIRRSTNKSGRVVCQRLSELRQRPQTTQGTQQKGKSSKNVKLMAENIIFCKLFGQSWKLMFIFAVDERSCRKS